MPGSRAFLFLLTGLIFLTIITSPPLVLPLLQRAPTPTLTATPVTPTATFTATPDPFAHIPIATPAGGRTGAFLYSLPTPAAAPATFTATPTASATPQAPPPIHLRVPNGLDVLINPTDEVNLETGLGHTFTTGWLSSSAEFDRPGNTVLLIGDADIAQHLLALELDDAIELSTGAGENVRLYTVIEISPPFNDPNQLISSLQPSHEKRLTLIIDHPRGEYWNIIASP